MLWLWGKNSMVDSNSTPISLTCQRKPSCRLLTKMSNGGHLGHLHLVSLVVPFSLERAIPSIGQISEAQDLSPDLSMKIPMHPFWGVFWRPMVPPPPFQIRQFPSCKSYAIKDFSKRIWNTFQSSAPVLTEVFFLDFYSFIHLRVVIVLIIATCCYNGKLSWTFLNIKAAEELYPIDKQKHDQKKEDKNDLKQQHQNTLEKNKTRS